MPQHLGQLHGRGGASPTAAAGAAPLPCERRRFLIVHNPMAGRNRVDLVRDIVRRLEQAGARADQHVLGDHERDEHFLAHVGMYDALIASGGDGTARSVVAMLHGHQVPFGLIPIGTGNVLAEELHLPQGAAEIADMLLHGPVVDISIASANGAPFLLMLGAGFDGDVIARLLIGLKRRIGKLAFGWPILAALAHKPQLFQVTIDGAGYETSWLVAANAARYAGRFLLSERTNVRSPGLNVIISHATSRRQRFRELLHLVAGRLEKASSIEMIPAHEVAIPDAKTIAVQVDGEAISAPSFRLVADMARTPMIVPTWPAGREPLRGRAGR
ncbi:MAG: diacylglycerol/lipid kinase family protein [Hyphomicrobiaceae bacterium]